LEAYKLKLDTNTINKIAKLARIRLSENEANEMLKDMNSILDWVELLNEVNTDKVEPLTNISSSTLTQREDEANDINSSDEILQNSPDKLEGYFAVPKVVE
jgi:aspartyl-tRNA(Asn)/glutamyl-tRNA(Gln) amidotransferase subunit C